jgi:hypothetical protein
VLRGSPTTDSGGWTARRACRRGGSAEPGSGGCWNGGLGELPAWERDGAVRLALVGAREGVEVFGR